MGGHGNSAMFQLLAYIRNPLMLIVLHSLTASVPGCRDGALGGNTGKVIPAPTILHNMHYAKLKVVEAAAANTAHSYTSALRYWAGWHAARYGIELTLPVAEAAVLQFVVDHVVRRSQALVAAGLKAKLGAWTFRCVDLVDRSASRVGDAAEPPKQSLMSSLPTL